MADELVHLHDLVEENGKTIRENNLENTHNIPIGALVEIKHSTYHGYQASTRSQSRLYVVEHDRDCDGTPLYTLSGDRRPLSEREEVHVFYPEEGSGGRRGLYLKSELSKRIIDSTLVSGLAEESLTLLNGDVEVLDWSEDK